MKKTYGKPDIVFEDFSLNTNIAAGCEKTPGNQTADCGVKWGKIFIFTTNASGCYSKVVEGSTGSDNMKDKQNNGLCYHNPSEVFNVFFS
jgi:hypothetical protein